MARDNRRDDRPCRQGFLRPIAPCRNGGFVYFVGGERGPIKIGWTQQDMQVRLASLQNGNPERLSVLTTKSGTRALESAYHSRFGCLRHTGEWFLRSRALMDEIARLQAEALEPVEAGNKLSSAQVREIRQNPEGLRPGRLAARYGVSRMMIWKIRAGRAWADPAPTTRPATLRGG